MKESAKTITDEQIKQLKAELLVESGNQMTNDTDACGMALHSNPDVRAIFRDRVVEIWNQREELAGLRDKIRQLTNSVQKLNAYIGWNATNACSGEDGCWCDAHAGER